MVIRLGVWVILSQIIPVRSIGWFMLYIAGLELSESNEVRVKYGFILGLKELLLLKSISQFRKTNKQTNKQKGKENKPMLGLT